MMVRPGDCVRVSDEESAKAREAGNEFFKKKKVKEALKYYDIAQERAESLDCLVKSLTNRALCHIKLGHFEDARFDCQEALRLDPKNVKAHYRLGVCHKADSDIESARKCFERALEIQPDHAASSKHLKLLEKQQQQQHSASRATTNEYRQLVRVCFFYVSFSYILQHSLQNAGDDGIS